MKVGDKVIINPNIPDEAWSKHGYGFHSSSMLKPGVFTIQQKYPLGGFLIGVEDKVYDEEWLLSVPLFKVGDTVTIRKDLSTRDKVPYSVAQEMEDMAGNTYTVTELREERTDSRITSFGDDGCLYKLSNKAESWSWSSPMFDLKNYKLKFKNYESRLQEQESPLRRGSGEIVCGICCRKHKPRVTVKSVGYKKVIGRG